MVTGHTHLTNQGTQVLPTTEVSGDRIKINNQEIMLGHFQKEEAIKARQKQNKTNFKPEGITMNSKMDLMKLKG